MSLGHISSSSNNLLSKYSNSITSLDGSSRADTADDDEHDEEKDDNNSDGDTEKELWWPETLQSNLNRVLLLVGEVEDGHMALEGKGSPVIGIGGLIRRLKGPEPEASVVP
ncbi:hypothetical protein NL676_030079 [Syzygium grande]|nr:hypothetical protein NL676_030079 [Syzygium grande]